MGFEDRQLVCHHGGTHFGNFDARMATYKEKQAVHVGRSFTFLRLVRAIARSKNITYRTGSGSEFVSSRGSTGRKSWKSINSHLKTRSYSFLGMGGSPTPTQTFGCNLTPELPPGSNRFIKVAVADRGSLDVPVLKVEATEQAGPETSPESGCTPFVASDGGMVPTGGTVPI